jgi:hypothetical protein
MLYFVNDLCRGHLGKTFGKSPVSVMTDVIVYIFRVDETTVPECNANLPSVGIFQKGFTGRLVGYVIISHFFGLDF